MVLAHAPFYGVLAPHIICFESEEVEIDESHVDPE